MLEKQNVINASIEMLDVLKQNRCSLGDAHSALLCVNHVVNHMRMSKRSSEEEVAEYLHIGKEEYQ